MAQINADVWGVVTVRSCDLIYLVLAVFRVFFSKPNSKVSGEPFFLSSSLPLWIVVFGVRPFCRKAMHFATEKYEYQRLHWTWSNVYLKLSLSLSQCVCVCAYLCVNVSCCLSAAKLKLLSLFYVFLSVCVCLLVDFFSTFSSSSVWCYYLFVCFRLAFILSWLFAMECQRKKNFVCRCGCGMSMQNVAG